MRSDSSSITASHTTAPPPPPPPPPPQRRFNGYPLNSAPNYSSYLDDTYSDPHPHNISTLPSLGTTAERDVDSSLQTTRLNGTYIGVENPSAHDYGGEPDVTSTIVETHYALLYLMTNPEDFRMPEGMLPHHVFHEDATASLPAAHTASQFFGVELEGMEVATVRGIANIAALFQRWLAIMPGADHYHVLDPPGLTIMRIAGGTYRVSATHRIVWTWFNEFLPEAKPFHADHEPFAHGDLVSMPVVDIFEADRDGKIVHYAPIIDNRNVRKTSVTVERMRRSGTRVRQHLSNVARSPKMLDVNTQVSKAAGKIRSMVWQLPQAIRNTISSEQHQLEYQYQNSRKHDADAFEKALTAAQVATDQGDDDVQMASGELVEGDFRQRDLNISDILPQDETVMNTTITTNFTVFSEGENRG
mmetsp:Transcript_40930/g.96044  ORF Transcript_40930/g.96044 Transcript_40930/m.96044 type:complete len:416 (-) Transcript_40930:70-1317(-)